MNRHRHRRHTACTLTLAWCCFGFAAVTPALAEEASDTVAAEHRGNHKEHKPGLSAALNLIPVPLDIGHIYNGHARRAVLFSAVETAFAVNAAVTGLQARQTFGSGAWQQMGATDRGLLLGSLASFVVTKAVSTVLCVRDARAIVRDGRLEWVPSAGISSDGRLLLGVGLRWPPRSARS